MSVYQPSEKWAGAYSNEFLLSISTCSGFRGTAGDPAGVHARLERKKATESEIGTAVLSCLAESRILDTNELQEELFLRENASRNYLEFLAKLLEFTKIKAKRTLLREMHNCGITLDSGYITITPMQHVKLEAWQGTIRGVDDYVVIGASEPLEKIGAALIEGFRRCVPKYPWQVKLGAASNVSLTKK